MKVYLHVLVDDEFTNQDTGELIKYSNALIYDDEHNNTKVLKGRRITKIKTSPDLIHSVDSSNIPGWFEAEVGIAHGGKLKFTKLTHIKS